MLPGVFDPAESEMPGRGDESRTDDGSRSFDADRYYEDAGEWPAEEAPAAANAQGALPFWNHPAWPEQAPDGVANPAPFHLAAFERGELHGIEMAGLTVQNASDPGRSAAARGCHAERQRCR